MNMNIFRKTTVKVSSHKLLRKLLKDVLQENKEGKEKREGNEIQKTSNPGKEKSSNHRREVPSEIWPTVLDSII